MRWTDGSGAVYGEDPYGRAGYTHTYGHEYGGSVTTDTASPPWEAVQPAQWTHPTGQTATAWDSPHGDVLTEQLPVFDTEQFPVFDTAQFPVVDAERPPVPDAPGHPVPGPDTPESDSARPVFVDSSGRRQRRVLRAARLMVIPAGGYVAVLISAMLGGPSISSPFVPPADSAHSPTPRASVPDSPSGTGDPARSARPAAARKNSGTVVRKAAGPVGRPVVSTGPTATPRPTAQPTTTAAPAPSHKGRALGLSHKPVK